MFDDSRSFVTRAFLRAEMDLDYRAWKETGEDAAIRQRLTDWSNRPKRKETAAEGAFIQTFFIDTWGYGDAGRAAAADVTVYPKLRIADAGAGGGSGEADAALGYGLDARGTPQVLCEFKDIRSALDAPQARKGNNRSPVRQCQDYIRGARKGLFGNEPVQPWWGLVTDMNEFRLYWWDRMPEQCLRFVIKKPRDLFDGVDDLLSDTEDACFDRFLFQRLFHRDLLLSRAGKPLLLRLIERQWVRERALEGEFYRHYKDVRERLFNVLTVHNRDFPGTRTDLLRLSQKLLDRFIFAFYCEDMGGRMAFPPQLIRDRLKSRSIEIDYEASGDELWAFFKRLFGMMNEGGQMGRLSVPHINGGLFSPDPMIEALRLPNDMFAAVGQGANDASLEASRDTLLYLCARYNYASRGDARESLSLYTLGRIFEQSITELEYRQGELENRDTVAALSERKRNGVYYTPEWAVNLLVKMAMDPWFEVARAAVGLPAEGDEAAPTLESLAAYRERLLTIRVVDPACGSGAFLISAFRRLLDERMALDRQIATLRAGPEGIAEVVVEANVVGHVLENNLYGVDLNPSSVEIAKLALWLHSARADAPLSSLDHTLRAGNSLVGPDFWQGRTDDPDLRERVSAFDWAAAFPEVRIGQPGGGFDIVLGNPPYVKRQHLQAAAPEVAAYLMASRGDDTYRSARTANFDLYLPFFEKGLRLMAPGGRMGFIAPSMWPINQYGEGLRGLVHEGRHLERWVDFKSYQVFDDVTVYTALQVFTRNPSEVVRVVMAPYGEAEAAAVDWNDAALVVPWDGLSHSDEWLMATGRDRALIERLGRSCMRLDDPLLTSHVFQGLITSADDLFHFKRIAEGLYWCTPNSRTRIGATPHQVEIEDALMKPLVSGADAKRYEEPITDTWLLFPYERDAKRQMKLLDAETFQKKFPKGWAHMKRWESELRKREKGAFDGDSWWRFGRHQNIDKQDQAKLVVPRIVEHMKVSLDGSGLAYLDNVDVGGVIAVTNSDLAYILGCLNSAIADYVFRAIAKPFRGDYRSANKQFIAPIPIPRVGLAERAEVAANAQIIQASYTRRRELLNACGARLSVLARHPRDERWLWPDIAPIPDFEAIAPLALRARSDRRDWARSRFEEAVGNKLEALQVTLSSRARVEASFYSGELRLLCGGAPILRNIFLDDREGRLVEAYWRSLLLGQTWRDAESLARALRRPPADTDIPAATQFIERVNTLAAETSAIETAEATMNARLFDLYDLTLEERILVEKDYAQRRWA